MLAPRRRFQFSLRTLFVVMTILSISLGWQTHRVAERKALFQTASRDGMWSIVVRAEPERIWWRRLTSDIEVEKIEYGNAAADQIERMKAVFPEAEVADYPWPDFDCHLIELIQAPFYPVSWKPERIWTKNFRAGENPIRKRPQRRLRFARRFVKLAL